MKISFTTPNIVEGGWTIHDKEGNVVTSSAEHPGGIVLSIEPHFYSPMAAQAISTVKTIGKSGKSIRQVLQISPRTGRVAAVKISDAPQAVMPFFDKPSAKNKQ